MVIFIESLVGGVESLRLHRGFCCGGVNESRVKHPSGKAHGDNQKCTDYATLILSLSTGN